MSGDTLGLSPPTNAAFDRDLGREMSATLSSNECEELGANRKRRSPKVSLFQLHIGFKIRRTVVDAGCGDRRVKSVALARENVTRCLWSAQDA